MLHPEHGDSCMILFSSSTVPPVFSTNVPVIHAGWSALLLVVADLLAVWLVCFLLLAVGLGVGYLLVNTAQELLVKATRRGRAVGENTDEKSHSP